MNENAHTSPLSPVWMKAALLGSVWASIEIVLGTFLHAVQFPLTGTLLSAIGVMILVAGSRLWDDQGLVWRTGIVCAAMKSISPGAVILGPMIGIALEAFLVELSLRLLGRSAAGYLLGGALAVSTPLTQKVVSLLFAFGLDAARLATALYDFVANSLRFHDLSLTALLIILLALNMGAGVAAALAGFAISNRVREQIGRSAPPQRARTGHSFLETEGRYSKVLLLLHVLVMPAGFLAIQELPLWASAPAVALYAIACFRHYPNLVGRFKRPRLWIEFAGISILAGLLFGGLSSSGTAWSGLFTGLRMTLRAGLVIVAFSAIGIEVRNPAVIRWFLRRNMHELPAALEVAMEALPSMTEALGEERYLLKHPVSSLARVLASAVDRVERSQTKTRSPIYLITGDTGSGKTTFLRRLVEGLRASGCEVRGIAAPAVFVGDKHTGYDLLDLQSDRTHALCRRDLPGDGPRAGPYRFFPEAIAQGNELLRASLENSSALVCIDEVGQLELDGHGWAPALDRASTAGVPLLLVIRTGLLAEVLERWKLTASARYDVATADPLVACEEIIRSTR